MKQFDLIIIGCGGIGSATLHQASLRGLKVLCLEQFQLGHSQGGSHGETRAFRMAYYDNPNYIPLLRDAYIGWKQLEIKANQPLFVENGVLEIANASTIKNKIIFLKKYNIRYELLNKTEMKVRFPDFFLPDGMIGLFQPQGGFLYVDQCIKFFVNDSIALGAEIICQEKVEAWNIDSKGKVSVKTDKATYQSKFLIFTTGAWTKELLPELNLNLEILQKKIVWSSVSSDSYTLEKNSPCFAYHLNNDLFYGFPNINGFIKVARHTGGSIYPLGDDKEEMAIKKFTNTYLKVNSKETRAKNCLYDNSLDKNFIIDNHPDYSQVAFAAGLSGHAYKMSLILSNLLIDFVLATPSKHNISFLSLKRFNKFRTASPIS